MTAQAGVTTSSSQALHKAQLRKTLRKRRATISRRERRRAAQRCADHLMRVIDRSDIRSIALYLAYGSELSTAPLLQKLRRSRCRLLLPSLRGQRMHFVEWKVGQALRANRFGIDEPRGRTRVMPAHIDAIVMPLTGFDAQGRRLGTGGGYYDRTLAALSTRRRPWRIGYAYALQECEPIADDPWDIKLHAVCTERGLRRFHG
jgi:5-formyltetrahydrofolate cyclo-ligase